MKNILKYSLFSLLMGLLLFATSCEDKPWSEDYDVNLPIPVISELSQSGALAIGSSVTITGSNFDAATASIKGMACKVVSINESKTVMVVTIPRIFEKGPLTVTNIFERFGSSEKVIAPIYPDVTITKVSDIRVGLAFSITGVNVDMIKSVFVNDVEVPISASSPTTITANVAKLTLKVGQLVKVTFKGLSNDIADVSNVNVGWPTLSYQEVDIMDFKSGADVYKGESNSVSIENGTPGIPAGNIDGKYFHLDATGYGWDKETGVLASSKIADLSSFVNPHLTFYVRTPVGKAGYFQFEDQAGNWRHFPDFKFDTQGEWQLVSVPVGEGWGKPDEFRLSNLKPKLSFKAGNAGVFMNIDIAYIKITEGAYDNVLKPGDQIGNSAYPAHTDLMGFEDASLAPDILNGSNVVGSLNFRHDGANQLNAFNGSNFFTFVDDKSIADGSWGSYWSSTLVINTASVDFAIFPTPVLSFQMNGPAASGQQYIILRFYQYNGGLTLIKKFFPESKGLWVPGQVDLFNETLENWSTGGTPLGDHYKTLKKLSKDAPIEKIEVICGRSNSNEILVSLDEFSVTNGPRY